jgi:hypothetical protein
MVQCIDIIRVSACQFGTQIRLEARQTLSRENALAERRQPDRYDDPQPDKFGAANRATGGRVTLSVTREGDA